MGKILITDISGSLCFSDRSNFNERILELKDLLNQWVKADNYLAIVSTLTHQGTVKVYNALNCINSIIDKQYQNKVFLFMSDVNPLELVSTNEIIKNLQEESIRKVPFYLVNYKEEAIEEMRKKLGSSHELITFGDGFQDFHMGIKALEFGGTCGIAFDETENEVQFNPFTADIKDLIIRTGLFMCCAHYQENLIYKYEDGGYIYPNEKTIDQPIQNFKSLQAKADSLSLYVRRIEEGLNKGLITRGDLEAKATVYQWRDSFHFKLLLSAESKNDWNASRFGVYPDFETFHTKVLTNRH